LISNFEAFWFWFVLHNEIFSISYLMFLIMTSKKEITLWTWGRQLERHARNIHTIAKKSKAKH